MMAGLDRGGGNGGQVIVPLVGDNDWHTYSIKLADVLANPIAAMRVALRVNNSPLNFIATSCACE